MEKIKFLVLVCLLVLANHMFAQNTGRDTINEPSDLGNGEILGLESEDRKIKPEGTKEKQRADKLYRDLGFQASSQAYQSLSKREKKSEKVLSRIANSHRLNSNTENAEYWYAKFINKNSQPKHLLHYAQVLQSNGKCEDAIRWYKAYEEVANKKDLKNRDFVVDCDASSVMVHDNVVVKSAEGLNTKHLDFSPVPYKDGIVFTTTRARNKLTDTKDNWTNDNYTDLFYAERAEGGSFTTPVPFIGEVNGKYHDGTATFNGGGSVMIFTRNNTGGKSRNGLIDLKIYTAYDSDGYWADVEELPFNSNEYSTCHPTLSADGRRLYFSSNRPDGHGGMDIYVCIAQGGSWSKPQNLGPTVNSSGNEIFPFVGDDGTLYYSSNGHQTIGGLDIFKAVKSNPDDEGSWSYRENMGQPFNSKKDDFGFYINKKQTEGYLSSSRRGGKGKDDIYTWSISAGELVKENDIMDGQFCVYEEGTDERIEKASVSIVEMVNRRDSLSGLGQDMVLTLKPLDESKKEYVLGISSPGEGASPRKNLWTNKKGVVNYPGIKRNKKYEITVEKKGYKTEQKVLSANDMWDTKEHCFSMTKRTCLTLDGITKNKKYDMPMRGVKVVIFDKCLGESTEIVTGEDGAFSHCIKCGCEYEITGTKQNFSGTVEQVSTLQMDCDATESVNTILNLELGNSTVASTAITTAQNTTTAPPVQQVATVPVTTYEPVVTYQPITTMQPVTRYVPVDQLTGSHLNAVLSGDPNVKLEAGTLFNLKDVYYDFDKFNIREDASIDLANVVRLMKMYPTMSISLESHTDSRGSDSYNTILSQNRASAARKYIVSRGIEGIRIVARGFGESQLKNQCVNGAECTEEAHQMNRRTEVRILKM